MWLTRQCKIPKFYDSPWYKSVNVHIKWINNYILFNVYCFYFREMHTNRIPTRKHLTTVGRKNSLFTKSDLKHGRGTHLPQQDSGWGNREETKGEHSRQGQNKHYGREYTKNIHMLQWHPNALGVKEACSTPNYKRYQVWNLILKLESICLLNPKELFPQERELQALPAIQLLDTLETMSKSSFQEFSALLG